MANREELAVCAARLRELHALPELLVLPNAWDVASARLVEAAGFPAVATTSAGIANALGYADGEHVPRTEMLGVVARIAAAVSVPVTADMEAGYSDTPGGVHETALELIAAGAVGLNLEDSHHETILVDVGLQVEKIQAVRAAAAQAGVPLVLNARTDAWLLPGEPGFDRWDEGLERIRRYRAAGADCVFAPGLRDLQTIRRLLQESPGPLNILGGPGAPPLAELAAAGVRRVSLGSGPARAVLGLFREILEELKRQGSYALIAAHALSYAEANRIAGGRNPGPGVEGGGQQD